MHASNGTNGITTKGQIKPTGLSPVLEARMRETLRRKSPSEPWVDAQFVEVSGKDARGEIIVRRMHDPAVFPPGGKRTLMMACKICGILTPPHAMEGGICLDHREDGNWGESPSAQVIRAIEYRWATIEVLDVPSEVADDLQREIREYGRNPSESPA